MKKLTVQLLYSYSSDAKIGDSAFAVLSDDQTVGIYLAESEDVLLDRLIQEMWEEEPTDDIRERFQDKVEIVEIGQVVSEELLEDTEEDK